MLTRRGLFRNDWEKSNGSKTTHKLAHTLSLSHTHTHTHLSRSLTLSCSPSSLCIALLLGRRTVKRAAICVIDGEIGSLVCHSEQRSTDDGAQCLRKTIISPVRLCGAFTLGSDDGGCCTAALPLPRQRRKNNNSHRHRKRLGPRWLEQGPVSRL
jgi:hypothetical protein